MKAWKIVALTVGGLIAAGSVAAGIVDRIQQKKAERDAKAEGKTIHKPHGPYEKYFKRPLDFAISSIALLVLSPLMALLALVVRFRLGSPVLFRQQRPGKDGKPFTLFKFRSLTEERDENGEYLPDEDRLTTFGAWERSTSLDELPELWNILKGDMSIVGPRPLLVRYLPYYTAEERRRHDVRPGLTGLAQVHGRNYTSWQERFGFDSSYVDKVTFAGDIRIVADTVKVVVSRSGVVDRSQIHADEKGDLYVNVDGVRRKYLEPLDVERATVQ